jgi:hypothetical protein
MRKIQYSATGMIQGAIIQYRNYFRTMALGGTWNVYRAESGETLSGVVLAPVGDCPGMLLLVEHVEAMIEQTLSVKLSEAIRKHGATPDYVEK